mmetsp:Transcript_3622/g.11260  ORF Transcript_3622/g.11260 Transcript_3622/m.11260 type:complete len:145 (-) Transcript_3622:45-479(-)
MRHGVAFRKLGRTTSHRRALLRNLATQLFKHDRIETTLPKAKELRRIADRMIKLAKRGDLHARRQALAYITERQVVSHMFSTYPKRFENRHSGYTTYCRTRVRKGDCAQMAMIGLLDNPVNHPAVQASTPTITTSLPADEVVSS